MRENLYLCDMSEWDNQRERAFNALLEYEINASILYDSPHTSRKMIPKHERVDFFAYVHGVTIKQMKDSWRAVEYYIERMSADEKWEKLKEIRTKYFSKNDDRTISTRETRRINLHTMG